jgi:hypothetical protein
VHAGGGDAAVDDAVGERETNVNAHDEERMIELLSDAFLTRRHETRRAWRRARAASQRACVHARWQAGSPLAPPLAASRTSSGVCLLQILCNQQHKHSHRRRGPSACCCVCALRAVHARTRRGAAARGAECGGARRCEATQPRCACGDRRCGRRTAVLARLRVRPSRARASACARALHTCARAAARRRAAPARRQLRRALR